MLRTATQASSVPQMPTGQRTAARASDSPSVLRAGLAGTSDSQGRSGATGTVVVRPPTATGCSNIFMAHTHDLVGPAAPLTSPRTRRHFLSDDPCARVSLRACAGLQAQLLDQLRNRGGLGTQALTDLGLLHRFLDLAGGGERFGSAKPPGDVAVIAGERRGVVLGGFGVPLLLGQQF